MAGSAATASASTSALEAKIVVLGAAGVGKTSLVMRYCKGSFNPAQTASTIGASFMTKIVRDMDTNTVVRLQIWDTAGQERFRSISRLYYRSANAVILCYSIADRRSFDEMAHWLAELRRNLPADVVLHFVGTKADVAAQGQREVPFERCIAFVADNLAPGVGSTPPPTAGAAAQDQLQAPQPTRPGLHGAATSFFGGVVAASSSSAAAPTPPPQGVGEPRSPSSKRSSGFWIQEAGWDACHEVSAESGEGVDEVFRVVTRKLVEQDRRMKQALAAASSTLAGFGEGAGGVGGGGAGPGGGGMGGGGGSAGGEGGGEGYGYGARDGVGRRRHGDAEGGYFDGVNPRASFRVGRDRRSWLFSPGFTPTVTIDRPDGGVGQGGPGPAAQARYEERDGRGRRCCH